MSRTHPKRNDPCPCGSGLKYKNCCAGKQRMVVGRVLGMPYWVAGLVAVAAVVLGVVLFRGLAGPPAGSGRNPGLAPGDQGPAPGAPAAWHYDSVNNRHWDPGHGHWHDGPPPASAGGSAPSPPSLLPAEGATPAPWQYDSAGNRHWDPGHGHWHDGPPPARAP